MPKVIPECRPEDEPKRKAAWRTYRVQLVTPMFGGGFEPGEPDGSNPFRASAIRGHLRFWWRATRGARFATPDKLKAAEVAIWGNTENPSRIGIRVRNWECSQPQECARYVWDPQARKGKGGWRLNWRDIFHGTDLPYALFPFQGKEPEFGSEIPKKMPSNFIESGAFTILTSVPDEVEVDFTTALKAWINFGGMGCRTRRGCGALFNPEVSFKTSADIQAHLTSVHAQPDYAYRGWPTLRSAVAGNNPIASLDSWNAVIGLMREFRQGANLGRDPGNTKFKPGRSRYPEPDTIRRILKTNSPGHEPRNPVSGFPRAEFGLPIIFHFKDEKHNDPADTTLLPVWEDKTFERMGSPLILKPLAVSETRSVPLILRLLSEDLKHVELANKANRKPQESVPIRSDKFAGYPDSPFKDRSGAGSAIEAFLAYAESQNFKEIK